jgi:hypothetical protein
MQSADSEDPKSHASDIKTLLCDSLFRYGHQSTAVYRFSLDFVNL